MARRKTTFLPGHYYHIYNRGANRQPISRNQDNYLFLIRRIIENSTKYRMSIISYCLMPNHYHMLIRQDSERPISEFIQAIFNSYTKAYNKAFNRTGTLFEGPFQAIEVANESHLLHLCRYIHRNPLDAGLVEDLSEWPFSNYLDWMEIRAGTLVDRDFIKTYFRDPDDYKNFVMAYIPPYNGEKDMAYLTKD